MEDPKWLRLITVGLILAALAIGYFLLTGGLVRNKSTKTTQVVSSPSPVASPNTMVTQIAPSSAVPATPSASASDRQIAGSAYNTIADRTKGGIQTLPATGTPVGLILLSATSAILIGYSLRKYPN